MEAPKIITALIASQNEHNSNAFADLFTEQVIRTMKQHCTVPIIFPLSNPSKQVEATPENTLFTHFYLDGSMTQTPVPSKCQFAILKSNQTCINQNGC